MLPKWHILLGAIFSLILYFTGISFAYLLIFFLSSFLIDIDHYFYYIIEERDFSFKKAYNWFIIKGKKWKSLSTKERKKHAFAVVVFHGLEPIIILFSLSTLFYPFFFIALGFLIHLLTDLFDEIPLGVAERKIFLICSIYAHLTKTKFYHR